MQHVLRISFDDVSVADSARTWVDFSSRLRSFSVDGGRDSELDEHETTKGEYLLDDRDRYLDPTNGASPYAPNVVPNRMLWHQIVDGGVTYDVLKGPIDTWGPEWDDHGGQDHRARIRVSDERKMLARNALEASDPDVLDYEDVITADEPSFYYRLGEASGTKVVHHARKKRKRRERESRRHYKHHGFKRWTTRVTRADAEGISGPAGTYVGLPTLGVPGLIKGDSDTAVRFDGVDDNVRVPLEAEDLIDTNRLTVEAWSTTSSASNNRCIVSGPYKTTTAEPVFNLMQDNTQHVKSVIYFTDGTNSALSGSTVLAGNYHLATTWDGTTHRVFVNGVEDGSNTPAAGKILRAGDTDRFLRIGCQDDVPLSLFWNNVIDEVAVYEKALPSSRLLAHYNAGLLGFPSASTGERILQVLELAKPGGSSALTFAGNEITDASRAERVQGDGRSYNPLIFEGDYTVSSERKWSSKQEAVAGRLTFPVDPATPSSGRHVGRFEVQNGDTVASGNRLEVVKSFERATSGDVRFYGGRFYIPMTWVDTITGTQFKIINQWKDNADLGPPNLAFRLANGEWRLQQNAGTSAGSGVGSVVNQAGHLLLPSFLKGVWNEWVMEVYWKSDATGYVRVWWRQGGAQAYTKVFELLNTPTLLTGGGTAGDVYAKEGLYRDISPRTETDVLYHDCYRIGRSWQDVAYGMSPGGDASTGFWPAATNLALNGNAATDLTGISALTSATVTRESSSDTQFGSTRVKVVTPGAATGEGVRTRTATSLQGTSGVAAGDTFVGSIFLKKKAAAPHGAVTVAIRIDYTDATNDSSAQSYDLTEYWHRYVTPVLTANGAKTINSVDIRVTTTSTAQAIEFYASGAMIEEGSTPTPYVHTDGAAATRSGLPRAQAPVTSLDETQGWFAAFVRMGFGATDTPEANPFLMRWRDDDNNEIYLRFNTATDGFQVRRAAAGASTSITSAAQVFPRNDYRLVIAAWTSTQIKVSVDGGAFTTAGNTNIPALAATLMDLGGDRGSQQFLWGDMRWALWGTGALTDANAATLYNYGPWALTGVTFRSWYGSNTTETGLNVMGGARRMPPARYAGLTPMEMIDDAVAAEGEPAFFTVTPSGQLAFLDSTHRGGPPFSTVSKRFGHAYNQPAETAQLSEEDAFLFNVIRGSTDDGTRTFTATDQDSIDRFGQSVLSLDTVPLGTDAEIQAYVDALLERFHMPFARVPSLRANSGRVSAAALLGIYLGALISVELPLPGTDITQESYVEGRKLSMDAVENILRAEFSISPR